MSEISLTLWLHPSMQIPFKFDDAALVFKIDPSKTISELMDECEAVFGRVSEEAGMPFQMQVSVLWNTKDENKVVNTRDIIGTHFVDGDTYGVYGDYRPWADYTPVPESDKIPVTILTGFLGAGKTTMLNYILREQRDKKIAIIENEFGAISIDDELLKEGTIGKKDLAEKIVVMDNGCMCCTIRGDLVGALEQMIAEMKSGTHLDMIMIETTGMADPVPIVRTFMASPTITHKLRLDGVLTVVDGKHLIDRLDEDTEEGKVNQAYQQVAFADKIVLNKLDLVGTDRAIVVRDRIRSINKYAKVIPAINGEVRMSEITDLCCHDMTRFAEDDITEEPEVDFGHGSHEDHGGHGEHGHSHSPREGHDHGSGHADHSNGAGHSGNTKAHFDSRVNSFGIIREGLILPDKLGNWMQILGSLPPERGLIYRIKAILALKDHPYKHVFHAVMDVSDETDASEWAPGEKKVSKIIFIGKSLDERFLRDGFLDIFEQ